MKIYEITSIGKPAKVSTVKKTPNGDEVTIDQSNGIKTTINTKQNPDVLTKDPQTGKTVYNNTPNTNNKTNKQRSIKPGDQIKIK